MISVIVLTKNSQNHFRECLSSILEQNYSDFEVIVVDAASTDITIKILSFEMILYPKIKVKLIHVDSNTSIGKARQIGCDAAEGEILAYVDSDVELPHKNWLENMSEPLSKGYRLLPHYKIAGVQTLAKCRDTDPEILKKIHSSFEYKNTIINSENYEMIGTSHLLIRKNLIQEVGGFIDVSMGEDTNLTDKIMKLGYSFVYLPDEKCYHHHIDNYWDYLKKSYRNYKHYFKTKLGKLAW